MAVSKQDGDAEAQLIHEIGKSVRGLLTTRLGSGPAAPMLGLDDPVVETIARHGFLSTSYDEESGGLGRHNLRVGVAIREECGRIGAVGLGLALGELNDVALPVVGRRLTAGQREALSGGLAEGAAVVAVAGLDGSIRAETTETGWRLDGATPIVVNAPVAEFLLVVARDGADTLCFLLPIDAPGVERGARLDLVGAPSLAVGELVLASTPAGREDLLGDSSTGRSDAETMLMSQEILLGAGSNADARYALHLAAEHAASRTAFGVPIANFQNTRLVLGDAEAKIAAAESQLEACLNRADAGFTDLAATAAARLVATDALAAACDTALQVHGGYGYMTEYPIAAAFAAASVTRLLGARDRAQLRESLGSPA